MQNRKHLAMWKRVIGALFVCLICVVNFPTDSFIAMAAGNDIPLSTLAAEREIMALAYLQEEIPVYGEPSLQGEVAWTVESGQTLFVEDACYNEAEGSLFLRVSFWNSDSRHTGYVERQFVACADERFVKWEKDFCAANQLEQEQTHVIYDNGVSSDVAKFPESYQSGLMELKNAHPQWVFVPMNTGIDWSTAITNELSGGKSLVYKTFPDCAKNGAYDDGNWFYATREILEYYMDPRNAMTDAKIFQFELLTYNETYHTESAVESFLNNTFMKSSQKAPGTVMTFAHIFWAIGREEGREVSPFHLAARVYQEQGQGTSPLISGTYPGYEGYYNYFNVKATGTTTTQVIVNGLTYAKQQGWNNAYASILGGSDLISANYIKKGQDTLYLEKFNVNPNATNPLYTHQYMQNISAPTTEGSSIKKLYESAGALNNSFVFKIPVFKNMPEGACPYPSDKNKLMLKLPSGYDTKIYVDGVPYTSTAKDGLRMVQLGDDKATTAVAYKYNSNGVPNGMYVWMLSGNNGVYTISEQPGMKDLLSYHGFSMRVTKEPSIRMKSGIGEEVKETLTSEGIDGYTLKEYGTLRIAKGDAPSGVLLKSINGVVTDVSYKNGGAINKVAETIAGRERFTSALEGIPASNYKQDYCFRSYAVLEKNGKEFVLYGPNMSRSLVTLTNQILKSGVYEKDSKEDLYLRQILADAEN